MKIKSLLCAALLALILLPAALCAAEITDEDMALGGIRIGDTRAAVEELYGGGNHYADGVSVWNGEHVGIHFIDYGASLLVKYRSTERGWHVTAVRLGVDVNGMDKYRSKPSEASQSFTTPRGIHLGSTADDLEAAYGCLPKPKCNHNVPPVCGYFYEGETAQIAFYICDEHSPGIQFIWLHEK